jgi:hypothetical protein
MIMPKMTRNMPSKSMVREESKVRATNKIEEFKFFKDEIKLRTCQA